MELKKGYKQTEVGVIPVDWEVKTLEDVSDIDADNLSSSTNPNYHFKYISLEDVDCGTLRNITDTVFNNAPSRARRRIKKNDILVSTVRPNLKSHLLIAEEVSDWICSTGFSVLRCKEDMAQSGYVFNHLFASIINKQIENLVTGSNYPAVNSKEVRALRIPLPPTKSEQTAIATALSDADALIESLGKLIAKKRDIKLGTMQQLLTGKKRLPGFSEDWEVKRLGDIFHVTRGQVLAMTKTTKESIGEYKYPVYSSQTKDNGLAGYYKDYLFENCITWTTDGANAGDVKYRAGKFYCTNVCGVLENEEGYSNLCVAAILNSVSRKYVSYVGNPKLMNNVVADIRLGIPSHIEEQTAITEVLSNMDAEIKALEKKRDKYKMIKQGMMQELLTGKTRLI